MGEIQEFITGEEAEIRYAQLRRDKIPLPKPSKLISKKMDKWSFGEEWKRHLHPCLCNKGADDKECLPATVYISTMTKQNQRVGWKYYTTLFIWYRAPKIFLTIRVTVSHTRFLRLGLRIEQLDMVERTFGRDSLIAT